MGDNRKLTPYQDTLKNPRKVRRARFCQVRRNLFACRDVVRAPVKQNAELEASSYEDVEQILAENQNKIRRIYNKDNKKKSLFGQPVQPSNFRRSIVKRAFAVPESIVDLPTSTPYPGHKGDIREDVSLNLSPIESGLLPLDISSDVQQRNEGHKTFNELINEIKSRAEELHCAQRQGEVNDHTLVNENALHKLVQTLNSTASINSNKAKLKSVEIQCDRRLSDANSGNFINENISKLRATSCSNRNGIRPSAVDKQLRSRSNTGFSDKIIQTSNRDSGKFSQHRNQNSTRNTVFTQTCGYATTSSSDESCNSVISDNYAVHLFDFLRKDQVQQGVHPQGIQNRSNIPKPLSQFAEQSSGPFSQNRALISNFKHKEIYKHNEATALQETRFDKENSQSHCHTQIGRLRDENDFRSSAYNFVQENIHQPLRETLYDHYRPEPRRKVYKDLQYDGNKNQFVLVNKPKSFVPNNVMEENNEIDVIPENFVNLRNEFIISRNVSGRLTTSKRTDFNTSIENYVAEADGRVLSNGHMPGKDTVQDGNRPDFNERTFDNEVIEILGNSSNEELSEVKQHTPDVDVNKIHSTSKVTKPQNNEIPPEKSHTKSDPNNKKVSESELTRSAKESKVNANQLESGTDSVRRSVRIRSKCGNLTQQEEPVSNEPRKSVTDVTPKNRTEVSELRQSKVAKEKEREDAETASNNKKSKEPAKKKNLNKNPVHQGTESLGPTRIISQNPSVSDVIDGEFCENSHDIDTAAKTIHLEKKQGLNRKSNVETRKKSQNCNVTSEKTIKEIEHIADDLNIDSKADKSDSISRTLHKSSTNEQRASNKTKLKSRTEKDAEVNSDKSTCIEKVKSLRTKSINSPLSTLKQFTTETVTNNDVARNITRSQLRNEVLQSDISNMQQSLNLETTNRTHIQANNKSQEIKTTDNSKINIKSSFVEKSRSKVEPSTRQLRKQHTDKNKEKIDPKNKVIGHNDESNLTGTILPINENPEGRSGYLENINNLEIAVEECFDSFEFKKPPAPSNVLTTIKQSDKETPNNQPVTSNKNSAKILAKNTQKSSKTYTQSINETKHPTVINQLSTKKPKSRVFGPLKKRRRRMKTNLNTLVSVSSIQIDQSLHASVQIDDKHTTPDVKDSNVPQASRFKNKTNEETSIRTRRGNNKMISPQKSIESVKKPHVEIDHNRKTSAQLRKLLSKALPHDLEESDHNRETHNQSCNRSYDDQQYNNGTKQNSGFSKDLSVMLDKIPEKNLNSVAKGNPSPSTAKSRATKQALSAKNHNVEEISINVVSSTTNGSSEQDNGVRRSNRKRHPPEDMLSIYQAVIVKKIVKHVGSEFKQPKVPKKSKTSEEQAHIKTKKQKVEKTNQTKTSNKEKGVARKGRGKGVNSTKPKATKNLNNTTTKVNKHKPIGEDHDQRTLDEENVHEVLPPINEDTVDCNVETHESIREDNNIQDRCHVHSGDSLVPSSVNIFSINCTDLGIPKKTNKINILDNQLINLQNGNVSERFTGNEIELASIQSLNTDNVPPEDAVTYSFVRTNQNCRKSSTQDPEYINILTDEKIYEFRWACRSPKWKKTACLDVAECIKNHVEDSSGGFMVIKEGFVKARQMTTKHSLYFTVIEGQAEVGIRHQRYTFEKGGFFSVPKGNEYYIKNMSTVETLKLSYVKLLSNMNLH